MPAIILTQERSSLPIRIGHAAAPGPSMCDNDRNVGQPEQFIRGQSAVAS
jgi:hypothetical protein